MMAPFLQKWETLTHQRIGLESQCPDAFEFVWMLEEFRISLFAQHMGTKMPVSTKRLEQQWGKIETWMQRNPR